MASSMDIVAKFVNLSWLIVERRYWIKVAFKTSGQSPGSSLEEVGISDGNCLGGDNGVSAVSGRGTDVTSAA
ncbi:hypothetical protein EVAR_81660_1 [Eumeta japonica]|uniref:Uncharacterized protein n=1 Tax=Eumeta variegata TaxID=151549 RepID=A0A4C1V3P2_EUMVA|nr:hypothetical protein EVAR_81660_1 [Eumeta japonica]